MNILKINKVSITGFKNHIEKVEFELSDFTKIEGENAKGKTTIGEAISWVFLGTNLFGNERADSDLVNEKAKITEIEVSFTTEDGEHELIRRRKGSKTDIYLDGNKVTNLEVRQAFGEKDIFLAIFNPKYFSFLSPKDAKEFLNKILGKIENEEVLEKMGEYERNLLLENNFKNSNLFLETKRSEIKEIDEDLIYIDGLIDGKKIDEKTPEEKQFDSSKLNNLRVEIEKLENIKPLHEIEDLRYKKNELEKEIFKLENSIEETSVTDIESQVLQLQMKKQHPAIEKPELIDIKVLDGKRELLLLKYNHIKDQLLSLNNAIKCNKCGNQIDLDVERKEKLKIDIEEVRKDGLQQKEEIEKSIESNKKTSEKYEIDLDDYKSKVEKEIEVLNEQRQKIMDEISEHKKEKVNKVLKLKKEINNLKIETLEKENKENEEKYKDKKLEVKEKIRLLEQVEYEVKFNNETTLKAIESIEKAKKEVDKLKTKIVLQEERKDGIKQQIDAAKLFNSTKLDIQTQNIEKHLNKVSIKLQGIVKSTGELKDTFKIMYEDTEYNTLSASEEIKVGLEIANLVMNLLDIKLPIFIDNAESITKYNAPDTQIIEARVVKGKELTVGV